MSRMVIPCPQCGSPARVRHSEQMAEHIRLQIFQCRRLGCGCQWKVLAQTVAIIAGSALPGASLALPQLNADDCAALFINEYRHTPAGPARQRRDLIQQPRQIAAPVQQQSRQQRKGRRMPWTRLYPSAKQIQAMGAIEHHQQPRQGPYSQPSLLPPACFKQQ